MGPFAAYCSAAAQLRQAEEAIERMAKQDPRGHALTVKGSAGSQVKNPLLRIASQARADRPSVRPDAERTATAQRYQAPASAVEVRLLK